MTSSSSGCGLARQGVRVDLVLVQVLLVPLLTRCHIEGLASGSGAAFLDIPGHCQASSSFLVAMLAGCESRFLNGLRFGRLGMLGFHHSAWAETAKTSTKIRLSESSRGS